MKYLVLRNLYIIETTDTNLYHTHDISELNLITRKGYVYKNLASCVAKPQVKYRIRIVNELLKFD